MYIYMYVHVIQKPCPIGTYTYVPSILTLYLVYIFRTDVQLCPDVQSDVGLTNQQGPVG